MTGPQTFPLPAWWTPDDIEHFDERAAICEHDGGLPLDAAEETARQDVEAAIRRRAERGGA